MKFILSFQNKLLHPLFFPEEGRDIPSTSLRVNFSIPLFLAEEGRDVELVVFFTDAV